MTDHIRDMAPDAGGGAHPPFERLSDLVDGGATLSPAERGVMERHLAGCAACRADADALRGVLALAREAPRSVEPPPEVWAGVRARLAPRRGSLRVRRLLWRGAPALAAAAVLLLAVGLLGRGGPLDLRALFHDPFVRAMTNRPAPTPAVAAAPPVGGDADFMQPFMDTLVARAGHPRGSDLSCTFARGATEVQCFRAPREPGMVKLARDLVDQLRDVERGTRASPLPRGGVPVPIPTIAVIRQTVTLDRAATELATAVQARAGALPPAARASLTQSLGVVDGAVAEARTALFQRPADPGIVDALAAAQERRLELLQQAARLLSED